MRLLRQEQDLQFFSDLRSSFIAFFTETWYCIVTECFLVIACLILVTANVASTARVMVLEDNSHDHLMMGDTASPSGPHRKRVFHLDHVQLDTGHVITFACMTIAIPLLLRLYVCARAAANDPARPPLVRPFPNLLVTVAYAYTVLFGGVSVLSILRWNLTLQGWFASISVFLLFLTEFAQYMAAKTVRSKALLYLSTLSYVSPDGLPVGAGIGASLDPVSASASTKSRSNTLAEDLRQNILRRKHM